MKNTILLLMAMMVCTVAFGQLKVVAPNGDVKVGNTAVAPTEKLDVDGNAVVRGNNMFLGPDNGFEFTRTNGGSSRFVHSGTGQYQFTALDASSITFRTNDLTRMQVRPNNGNLVLLTGDALKPGGGMWSVFSDKRLKTDIKDFEDGLSELMKINPVTFRYTKELLENNNKEFVGVIAQEVQEVAPYMTEKSEIYDTNGEVKSSDYLSVDPNAFTYMLINAVQEQQELIEDQNDIIEKLTKRMDALENGLGNINNDQEVELSDEGLAKLNQNEPNPFSEETTINYSIPRGAKSATLVVTNLNGQVIKNVRLDLDSSQIKVKAYELSSGTYVYSLLVDGNLTQTKKMILTK